MAVLVTGAVMIVGVVRGQPTSACVRRRRDRNPPRHPFQHSAVLETGVRRDSFRFGQPTLDDEDLREEIPPQGEPGPGVARLPGSHRRVAQRHGDSAVETQDVE